MKDNLPGTELTAHRPEPISAGVETQSYERSSNLPQTIEALVAGKYILISAFYSDGLDLLNEVHAYLKRQHSGRSFQGQKVFRAAYRKLSNLVLIQIQGHQLHVKKAPSIGWLEKLYPETNEFLLTFPQIQGLNSAWQWYKKGVLVPVLRNKIHPYYGVYFPTRFEHLHLIDNWLKRYDGPKKTAVDVGIGCGVLSFLLMKHGFQKAFGTDVNPNAIIGLQESMQGTKLSRKIEIDFGHLFGKWEKQTELIVFNPPWLPASHELDRLDEAMYYNEQLFPEFFQAAKERLLPGGRIVLLFSNLGQITDATKVHPIKQELEAGNRFQLEKHLKKSVKIASNKTKRNQHWRNSEEVELWVLAHQA